MFVPFSLKEDKRAKVEEHRMLDCSCAYPIFPASSPHISSILVPFDKDRSCNYGYCGDSFGYIFNTAKDVFKFFNNHTRECVSFLVKFVCTCCNNCHCNVL